MLKSGHFPPRPHKAGRRRSGALDPDFGERHRGARRRPRRPDTNRLFLHLMSLPQLQNRLRVQVQWFWSYLTGQRSSRLIPEVLPAKAREPER